MALFGVPDEHALAVQQAIHVRGRIKNSRQPFLSLVLVVSTGHEAYFFTEITARNFFPQKYTTMTVHSFDRRFRSFWKKSIDMDMDMDMDGRSKTL